MLSFFPRGVLDENLNLIGSVSEGFPSYYYSIDCMERKKIEHIYGTTNRTKPVLYPTIQLVIVMLYTKYELSILYSCGDIFDQKCRQKENG